MKIMTEEQALKLTDNQYKFLHLSPLALQIFVNERRLKNREHAYLRKGIIDKDLYNKMTQGAGIQFNFLFFDDYFFRAKELLQNAESFEKNKEELKRNLRKALSIMPWGTDLPPICFRYLSNSIYEAIEDDEKCKALINEDVIIRVLEGSLDPAFATMPEFQGPLNLNLVKHRNMPSRPIPTNPATIARNKQAYYPKLSDYKRERLLNIHMQKLIMGTALSEDDVLNFSDDAYEKCKSIGIISAVDKAKHLSKFGSGTGIDTCIKSKLITYYELLIMPEKKWEIFTSSSFQSIIWWVNDNLGGEVSSKTLLSFLNFIHKESIDLASLKTDISYLGIFFPHIQELIYGGNITYRKAFNLSSMQIFALKSDEKRQQFINQPSSLENMICEELEKYINDSEITRSDLLKLSFNQLFVITSPPVSELILSGELTYEQALFLSKDYRNINALEQNDIRERFISGDLDFRFLTVPALQDAIDAEEITLDAALKLSYFKREEYRYRKRDKPSNTEATASSSVVDQSSSNSSKTPNGHSILQKQKAIQQAIAPFFSDQKDQSIPTLGDGNCAFNSVAIGVARLVLAGKLPRVACELLQDALQLNSQSFLEWLQKSKNSDYNAIQKTLAPILRTMAYEKIEECYDSHYHELYENRLLGAYEAYLDAQPDDTFSVHPFIREQFDTLKANCPDLEQARIRLFYYWNNQGGKQTYFDHMKQPQESLGREHWASHGEIAVLAECLEINIHYKTNESSSVEGMAHGSLEQTYQNVFTREMLRRRGILQPRQNKLALRACGDLNKKFQAIAYHEKLVAKLDSYAVSQGRRIPVADWLSFLEDEVIKNQLIEELKQREAVIEHGGNYYLLYDEVSSQPGTYELQTDMLKVLINEIPADIQGQLLTVYIEKPPGFTVAHEGQHWRYVITEEHASLIQDSDKSASATTTRPQGTSRYSLFSEECRSTVNTSKVDPIQTEAEHDYSLRS